MERPAVEDTFVARILKALDMSPREFAKKSGIKLKEIEERLNTPEFFLGDADRDTVLQDLEKYINLRLGLLLAIRYTLQRTLQKDRIERLQRFERFGRYHADKEKIT